MKFIKTAIPDVIIVEPDVHRDHRGFFLESYNQKIYRENGISANFVQDNHSKSEKGILRGLHSQNHDPQAKLVRVVKGAVLDVAVDVRIGSPTFGKWVSAEFSEDNFRQLFVPQGFLHGFYVLSDTAEFLYKCDNFYSKPGEIIVRWDDPQIGIDWPVKEPILSEKDKNAPFLKDILDKLPKYRD
jgi:dTDP-4-dehydrorhamnose 3,5-epimerase